MHLGEQAIAEDSHVRARRPFWMVWEAENVSNADLWKTFLRYLWNSQYLRFLDPSHSLGRLTFCVFPTTLSGLFPRVLLGKVPAVILLVFACFRASGRTHLGSQCRHFRGSVFETVFRSLPRFPAGPPPLSVTFEGPMGRTRRADSTQRKSHA